MGRSQSHNRWLLSLAPTVALWVATPAVAAPTTEPPPRQARDEPEEEAVPAPEDRDGERFRGCERRRWFCCLPDEQPCTRPGPARLLLGMVGLAAAASGAAMLAIVGDRIGTGDPAGLLAGGGATAMAGALLGATAGFLLADGPAHPDRLRPATMDLAFAIPQNVNSGEYQPPGMMFRIAPTYFFPNDQGRIRLLGGVGGLLGTAREVDPRPQPELNQSVALRERELRINVGVDLAVNLPYPVLPPKRSAFLGAAELRYKPEAQIRRETFDPGSDDERVVERTMLLPLTVGVRWHLSPRQRFTLYFGPRFDFVSYSEPGTRSLDRGQAQIGSFYGEAWYDIDVPMTDHPRKNGKPRKTDAIGMMTIGYIHTRFDGRGLDFERVIGFLGPINATWRMRFRRRGDRIAAQTGLGTWIGKGVTVFAELGVVLPDLGRKP